MKGRSNSFVCKRRLPKLIVSVVILLQRQNSDIAFLGCCERESEFL